MALGYGPLVCLAVAMAGQKVRGLCVGFTPRGTSGRNTKEGQVAESLNTLGMYSMCRHPLYLGNLLMWLGIVMYMGHLWFAVAFLLVYALYYERIMFAEEQFLRGKFGQAYLDWAAGVPAFWPALGRWKSPEVGFSLRNVLKREYNGFFAMFPQLCMGGRSSRIQGVSYGRGLFLFARLHLPGFLGLRAGAGFCHLHRIAHVEEGHQGPRRRRPRVRLTRGGVPLR